MRRINPYLTFNGNCQEAMRFYQECLGGELTFQTIGDSPLSDRMPERMKRSILHATLVQGDLIIMASDMVEQSGLRNGNAVSLMLDCGSETEILDTYHKLSAGGERTHPLERSFWGALFGGLTDKYGHHWLLHFQEQIFR